MADFIGGFNFNNDAAVVEVGVDKDGTLEFCRNPVTGEEMGGADNYVETITGTAADVFNTNDYYTDALAEGLLDGSISAIVTSDFSVLGKGTYKCPLYTRQNLDTKVVIAQYTELEADDPLAVQTWWYKVEGGSGMMMASYDQNGLVNLNTVAQMVPVSINIYHHPMPE